MTPSVLALPAPDIGVHPELRLREAP
jgi:hypothetical protein